MKQEQYDINQCSGLILQCVEYDIPAPNRPTHMLTGKYVLEYFAVLDTDTHILKSIEAPNSY